MKAGSTFKEGFSGFYVEFFGFDLNREKMRREIPFRSRLVAHSGSVWSSIYDRFCVWV